MAAPPEITFGLLLVVGVGLMLLAAGALVLFVVTYQRRLLRQQEQLRSTEAGYQQALLAAVIAAQEAERERIGRDLHDDVASSVAMARMLVDRLALVPAAPDAPELLALAREVLATAVDEVRTVSHDLYPTELARAGLVQALQYLATLCRRTTPGLAVALDTDYPRPLPLPQELALYRICQELVHNTQKHAPTARHLRIGLWQQGPLLVLAVEDDGPGSAPAAPASAGVGLRSVAVRVEMLGARLHQHTAPGEGFHIRIELDHS